jgi:hypothetical protein
VVSTYPEKENNNDKMITVVDFAFCLLIGLATASFTKWYWISYKN